MQVIKTYTRFQNSRDITFFGYIRKGIRAMEILEENKIKYKLLSNRNLIIFKNKTNKDNKKNKSNEKKMKIN